MLTTILAMRGTARAIATRARAALTLGAPLGSAVCVEDGGAS